MVREQIVAAEGLTKVFRPGWRREPVVALDSLDLQIQEGEVIGLLGPNGAGKTTTINLLLGFLKPTRGQVQVLGAPPRTIRTREKIGYLPEESNFYRFLTGEELLHYFGRLFGMPRKQRKAKVDALLSRVGMEHARKRRMREYSKGMQRRIGIAQALINDPKFVIFDEPTSGLDPIGTREVKDLIVELKNGGTTVLFCSHLLAEIEQICDRVVMLYRGKKIEEGTLSQLLSQPDQRTVSFRGLDEGTLAKVKAAAESGGAEVTKVGNPVDSLESYFLRTLRERQGEES